VKEEEEEEERRGRRVAHLARVDVTLTFGDGANVALIAVPFGDGNSNGKTR
jgi:hypothetical protein